MDEALFEQLREWRAARAKEQSLPAYCVFTDTTLTAIAEARPGDRRGLAAISGVGASKLDRYADEVLALLTRHADPGGGKGSEGGDGQEGGDGGQGASFEADEFDPAGDPADARAWPQPASSSAE
jgi:DNA helicase-2/ATP-dependent DNA helicase PcrA